MSGRCAIVVGGGITGLTCAMHLARTGHEVTVLDGRDGPGGLAAGTAIGNTHWDRFYHVILEGDVHTRRLLDTLGLESKIVWKRVRNALHIDGATHPFSSAADFLRLPALSPLEKLRFAATILESRFGASKRFDRMPALDHLERWSGRRTVERVWKPLLRAKLGDEFAAASAAFVRATFARLYSARPRGAGAERFGYVPGGYGLIIDRLAAHVRRCGVHLQIGAEVREILRSGELIAVRTASGTLHADRVVLTMPSPACASMVRGLDKADVTALTQRRYTGVVCVSLLIDAPGSGYYLTNVADDGVPFTGIVEATGLIDRAAVGGHTLVYLPKYASSGDPIFTRDDDDLRDEFVGALRRLRPEWAAAAIVASRVDRARCVFAFPALGDAERNTPLHTSVRGVAIVNSARIRYATLNVSDTIASAEAALEELSHDPRWSTEENETSGRHIA